MYILLKLLGLFVLHSHCMAEVPDICMERVCEFHLNIRKSRTMVYQNANGTFNVELTRNGLKIKENIFRTKHLYPDDIGSFVNPEDVHTGDGFPRNLFLINDKFPGPTMEVTQGCTMIIHVTNNLNTAGLTIHWHGMEMPGTPEMDGTQYVTQCPIQPMQMFTYKFRADTPGTKWYHAHAATMRLDAFFGFIIVHKAMPMYPYFVLSLMEWLHVDYDTMVIMNPNLGGAGDVYLSEESSVFSIDGSEISSLGFSSILINGRGRWQDKPYPLHTYIVDEGQRYRFHMAHNGAESPLIFSIDSHKIFIVALDGGEVRPIGVDSFWIFPGETLDFEIEATQRSSYYWIRAVVAGDGIGPHLRKAKMLEGRAILRYRMADSSEIEDPASRDQSIEAPGGGMSNSHSLEEDPLSEHQQCNRAHRCKVFACPFGGYPDSQHKQCISMNAVYYGDDLTWLHNKFGLDCYQDVHEYFFNVGLQLGSSINGRSFVQPRRPLIWGDYDNYIKPCPKSCDQEGCRCTHLFELPYNKTIQLVLTNYKPNDKILASHPIHIHGHSFAILKVGYPDYDRVTGRSTKPNSDVTCDSALCSQPRWTHNRPWLNMYDPPTKDTVVVPANGYVVIRFRSTLPGYWFMHCHQDEHFLRGMVLIFKEGVEHIKLPRGFPRCGDFCY